MNDSNQEWPAHGGSFTRQPDGSLARNEEKPAVKDASKEAKTPKKKES